MATEVRHRRGTSAQLAAAIPAQSELIHNVETNRIHVGDGSTPGGHPLASLNDLENVTDSLSLVSYAPQELTPEQQEQARENMGLGYVRSWTAIDDAANWRSGRSWPYAYLVGDKVAEAVPSGDTSLRSVVAIGDANLHETTSALGLIAIGTGIMAQGQPGPHNIGIGHDSLSFLDGGDRNIAIGSLALHFLTTGHRNTAIGRDAGHGVTTGTENVAVGYQALSADGNPFGLSGEIENQRITNPSRSTAVGTYALRRSVDDYNVAVGFNAGAGLIGGLNTIVGARAGAALDSDLSENGKVISTVSKSGTYSQVGNTITVSIANHGVIAGNKIGISFDTGQPGTDSMNEVQWITVASVVNTNSFTITSPKSMSASGNCTLTLIETNTTRPVSATNTIVGERAVESSTQLDGVTAVGWRAGQNLQGDNRSTAIGRDALRFATTGSRNVAIGHAALANTVSGGEFNYSGCVGLGDGAVTSGDNQVQLGNSSTTVYAYGAVQNRSDARDKADVRDTILGLDFINKLRPVDFRWDMRDDYVEVDPETGEVKRHEKDGSKKRNRYHHGLIAQEVKNVLDELGVDFGGYQDHSVNGGSDVLSIGYDELIAPLIKAVQELSARVAELEDLLSN